MGWTVQESNPGEARFSASARTGSGDHPPSVFSGVKRPRRDVDHPPHVQPRFKKE